MTHERLIRNFIAGVFLLSSMVSQAGPTQAQDAPVKVDLGNAIVEVSGPPKRLAVFIAGSGKYTYSNALIEGAQDAAKAAGIEADVFQANFDATVQYNQVQNAITSGKYDLFALQPANASEFAAAETALAAAQARVLALLEQHRELAGDADLAVQRAALGHAAQRLGFARQLFNDAVHCHNLALRQFPARLLATLLGFGPAAPL